MRRLLLIGAIIVLASGCSETPVSPTRADGDVVGQGSAATDARIDTSFGQGGMPVAATLTGAAEIPGPGDPDGSGTARITLNSGQGQVCFALEVSDIAPATASHIHVGGPTVAGDVVVTLAPAPTDGASSACVSAAPELVRAIGNNPAEYYVNVHNEEFPTGALRGQLSQ
jgi:hypothetical protein